MIKVFVDDKPLVFAENFSDENYIRYTKLPSPQQLTDDFKKSDINGGFFMTHQVEHDFNQFSSQFKVIFAAGGVIFNDDDKLLMIKRLGKWDLPKGKMDEGESAEETALREVCEETGVCHAKIISQLDDTYHIYQLRGQYILKRTYWFRMLSDTSEKIKPQTEEDILEVKWKNKDEVKTALKNSYGSVRDLLSKYITD
ncbi:MAG: Diadenosine hexaphosphate hydrolase [Bacteroidetes bacterium ADurb.Bin141]|nr:MAG: Diadenosine hexaphosphate hydrolase [Bacteroidetes bacterium ADurb.Bin141]